MTSSIPSSPMSPISSGGVRYLPSLLTGQIDQTQTKDTSVVELSLPQPGEQPCTRLSKSGELELHALIERSERLLEAQRAVQDFQRQVEVVARVSEAGVETVKRMSQVGGV